MALQEFRANDRLEFDLERVRRFREVFRAFEVKFNNLISFIRFEFVQEKIHSRTII